MGITKDSLHALPGLSREDFRIVRLAEGDARCKSDHLADFRELILTNQGMYPRIEQWYRDKVLPGLRCDERVAFVGYLHEQPVISAVVKKGGDAKFCHLKIAESLQNTHLGELFFSVMALEIRDLARSIYFTLPETLWETKGAFFKSFGFTTVELANEQYRLFDRELRSEASFAQVWRAALEKLPKIAHLHSCGGFSPDNQLLLSVRPDYAQKIFSGKKTVELRRKFSYRWVNHRINIYASAPVMSLMGEARISRVVADHPNAIWSLYHERTGCSRAEFELYAENADILYAIELDEVKPYREWLPLVQMEKLVENALVPPQSYLTLEKNKPWAKAVSIAAYLHGCLRSTINLAVDIGRTGARTVGSGQTKGSIPSHVQQELDLF